MTIDRQEFRSAVTHEQMRGEMLADSPVRAEYERLAPRERLISQIISARIAREWSQTDLACAAGVNRSVITRLESGESDPRGSLVVKVFDTLGITLTADDGVKPQRLA